MASAGLCARESEVVSKRNVREVHKSYSVVQVVSFNQWPGNQETEPQGYLPRDVW